MKIRTIFSVWLVLTVLSLSLTLADSALAASSIYLPLIVGKGGPPPAWLERVNQFRALAGLNLVTENPAWSNGDYKHAIYTVKNGVLGHSEDPANPFYTPAGDAAARNSNVWASSTILSTDLNAIDGWMVGPFHGLGIIDPRLLQVGFGSYREAGATPFEMAAALDVLHGLSSSTPPEVTFPVMWPANGQTALLTSYTGGEFPDPLSSCAGFDAPTGAPIYLQLGPGNVTPAVTAFSIKLNAADLPACEYDQTNYTNSDAGNQDLGRNILGQRSAIILIPRQPLTAGSYQISVTTNGSTYSWSFNVAP